MKKNKLIHKPLPLIPSIIGSFRVTKRILNPTEQQNKSEANKYLSKAIDFSDDSNYAAISFEDNSINLIDCTNGTLKTSLYSKKYGVGVIKFSHSIDKLIYASDPSVKSDEIIIRYLSLPDNRYIRYFRGHTDLVSSLQVSPHEDTFFSASMDKTVRFWDIRNDGEVLKFGIKGNTHLGLDPTGRVLAVADQGRGGITLFDIRKIQQGGFQYFNIETPTSCKWTSLKFTNDGENLLLTTNGAYHHVFNAFDGRKSMMPLFRSKVIPNSLNNEYSLLNNGADVSISPDGRFVFSGCYDGTLDIWDLKYEKYDSYNLQYKFYPAIKSLISHKNTPITTVGFNPGYMSLLTGSYDLACWQPNLFNLFNLNDKFHFNAKLEDYKNNQEESIINENNIDNNNINNNNK
ncbi:WD40 repeat-like protein [Neoconidiobolus thromboides FSU 785]|nr:WD40 repeat-like protein [Neoconidiobolus thromboides FSU 785]